MKKIRIVNRNVWTGASNQGKSFWTHLLSSGSYQEPLKVMAGSGKGGTTPEFMQYAYVPELPGALVYLKLKTVESVMTDLHRFYSEGLVPVTRHMIGSVPEGLDEEGLRALLMSSVESHIYPKSKTFKLTKLVVHDSELDQKWRNLVQTKWWQVYKLLTNKQRNTFNDITDKSKKDDAIKDFLDSFIVREKDSTIEQTKQMAEDILNSAKHCLNHSSFTISVGAIESPYEGDDQLFDACTDVLAPDKFEQVLKTISNSDSERSHNAACIISCAHILVPTDTMHQPTAVLDFAGFDNDSNDNISERIGIALNTEEYDNLFYFTGIGTTNANDTKFLQDISKTIRPSKLIIVITKFDRHEIFDKSSLELSQVEECMTQVRKDMKVLVEDCFTGQSNVVLPTYNDIICVGKTNIHMSDEVKNSLSIEFLGGLLRDAIARGWQDIRRKVRSSGTNRLRPFAIFTNSSVDSNTIAKKCIHDEYSQLCAKAHKYHHFSLDAGINALLNKREYASQYTTRWDALYIKTFSLVCEDICKSLGDVTFLPSVQIHPDDVERVKKEFIANTRYILSKKLRDLLVDPSKAILNLIYFQSKYTEAKPKVFTTIEAAFIQSINAVNMLEEINNIIELACVMTYDRLFI